MFAAVFLAGLVTGSVLNWAGDYLPRFAASRPAPLPQRTPRFTCAMWRLAAAVISRRRITASLAAHGPGAAIEMLTAALFVSIAARSGLSWEALALVAACCFFILVALVDLRYRLVLNVMIYPAIAVTLLIRFASPGTGPLTALIGGALGLAIFSAAALARPGGLGWGDVKLATLIGLLFSFPHALWPLSVGILAGGLTAVFLLGTRRWTRRSIIPYAPFLCLGALVALFYNPLSAILIR